MDESQERLIRVTIGQLARQLHELVTCTGALHAVVNNSLGLSDTSRTLLGDVAKELAELDASVMHVIAAFPPEDPSNGSA